MADRFTFVPDRNGPYDLIHIYAVWLGHKRLASDKRGIQMHINLFIIRFFIDLFKHYVTQ